MQPQLALTFSFRTIACGVLYFIDTIPTTNQKQATIQPIKALFLSCKFKATKSINICNSGSYS